MVIAVSNSGELLNSRDEVEKVYLSVASTIGVLTYAFFIGTANQNVCILLKVNGTVSAI